MSEIWAVETSYARPRDVLYEWRVWDANGVRRFVGLANRVRVPTVTPAILHFDPEQRQGTTRSGHVYMLADEPAPTAVDDVTDAVAQLMAAEPGWRKK